MFEDPRSDGASPTFKSCESEATNNQSDGSWQLGMLRKALSERSADSMEFHL